eukprot:snap_masked-scaffold_2-processed-gene-22.25-mRNA-1 protein AED:1.00 eAED:1.00 QI:0/-1/0/0/-1/1/1/0/68
MSQISLSCEELFNKGSSYLCFEQVPLNMLFTKYEKQKFHPLIKILNHSDKYVNEICGMRIWLNMNDTD